MPEGMRRSLSELRPLQGIATMPLVRRHVSATLEHIRASRGFSPLRRSQMVASTNLPAAAFAVTARAYLTRYVPPSGSLTLLTVYSATTPVGLFHPTRALGVPPFRAFSQRAGTPLGALCPPDVSLTDPPRRPLRRPAAPDHGPEQWYQRALRRKPTNVAFRALLPSEVRDIVAVV